MKVFVASQLVILLALSAGGASSGEPPPWRVDAGASHIRFIAKLMGGKIRGSFKTFTADIRLDPDDLKASNIRAVIPTASVTTRNSERDAEILKSEWFDAASFPEAVFASTAIRKAGTGYETAGTLSIKGVTREVRFPFVLEIAHDGGKTRVRLSGETTIDRNDYRIGAGKWAKPKVLAAAILVSVQISAEIPP